MDTFSIVRNALAKTESDPDKAGLDPFIVTAGRVLDAVQTVVDALTPPDGGRYIVALSDINTAGTMLGEHRIIVSSKPLKDRTLSLVEKAVVIATLSAHEIGHTMVTRPRKMPVNLVEQRNGHSGYHTLANIADDIILEPFMVDRFPILADAFEFTGLWVLRSGAGDRLPLTDVLNAGTSAAERFNIVMHATRYGDIPEIVWSDGPATRERDWARDWKTRLLAVPLADHQTFLDMVDELWARVRMVDDTPEPEPEPEPLGQNPDGTNENESEPEQGEGEGDGGEGDDGEPTEGAQPGMPKQGDDFDEDTDGDEATDGEGNEPGEGNDDGADGDGEDGDEPGGDTGSGDSESGGEGDGDDDAEPDGWDGSQDDSDVDGHDGHADGKDDGEPAGGGDAEADAESTRSEDDWEPSEVEKTAHDEAETTFGDESLAAAVRTYNSTTTTVFGIHGHMSTQWD